MFTHNIWYLQMLDVSIAKFKIWTRKRLYLDQYKDFSCMESRHNVCRAQIFVSPYVKKRKFSQKYIAVSQEIV